MWQWLTATPLNKFAGPNYYWQAKTIYTSVTITHLWSEVWLKYTIEGLTALCHLAHLCLLQILLLSPMLTLLHQFFFPKSRDRNQIDTHLTELWVKGLIPLNFHVVETKPAFDDTMNKNTDGKPANDQGAPSSKRAPGLAPPACYKPSQYQENSWSSK